MSRAQQTSTVEQNTGGAVAPFVAGKNKVINGAFDWWQRGTSFTASSYTADRFRLIVGNSTTVSQQTFTPGTAPVAGYEGQYFLRLARTTSTTSDYITQKIENVQTFAGQTVTLSFWAKADASSTVTSVYLEQNFGSGGSGAVATGGNSPALTTSWTRFSYTYSIPSISGKTIGTSSFLDLVWNFGSAMGNRTIDIWGVQVEAGSVATSFTTATGTLQGELAACYRYFQKFGGTQVNESFPYTGFSYSTTQGEGPLTHKCTMRTTPSLAFSTLKISDVATYNLAVTNLTLTSSASGPDASYLAFTVASGTSSGKINYMRTDASTAGYIYLSAEL